MIAGPQGAVVLSLDRARLLALCDEDAILGVRVLWNIAQAMSRRIRYILWQLDNSTDAGGSQPSPEPLLPTTPVGRRLRDMV